MKRVVFSLSLFVSLFLSLSPSLTISNITKTALLFLISLLIVPSFFFFMMDLFTQLLHVTAMKKENKNKRKIKEKNTPKYPHTWYILPSFPLSTFRAISLSPFFSFFLFFLPPAILSSLFFFFLLVVYVYVYYASLFSLLR